MASLSVIGLPIGNLGDLSPRAKSTLEAVQLIFAEDTRSFLKLSSLCSINIQGKLLSVDHHQEQARVALCLQALAEGKSVALVSEAGTPGINDPGARLVQAVRQAGFEVVAVPGPSILSAALSISGWDGPVWVLGFAPRTAPGLVESLANCPPETAILFLESPRRIRQTLGQLPAREVVVFHELTKMHEGVFEGTGTAVLQQLDEQPKGEWAILIKPEAESPQAELEAQVKDWLGSLLPLMSPSQAAKVLSKHLGLPKNRVYALAQEFQGARGEFAPDPEGT